MAYQRYASDRRVLVHVFLRGAIGHERRDEVEMVPRLKYPKERKNVGMVETHP